MKVTAPSVTATVPRSKPPLSLSVKVSLPSTVLRSVGDTMAFFHSVPSVASPVVMSGVRSSTGTSASPPVGIAMQNGYMTAKSGLVLSRMISWGSSGW